MTLKQLFQKVETLNKLNEELEVNLKKLQVQVMFYSYNTETFESYNKLLDYLVNEYIVEYQDAFIKAKFEKTVEWGTFKAEFEVNTFRWKEKNTVIVTIVEGEN